ncbi:MAG: heavy metal translocating P-type ATPase [Bacteroidia bacterium]
MEPVRKNFPVTGMSCASCALSVESTLGSLKGIVKAGVNFANASALVEFIPSEVSPDQMKTALQSIGYDLILDEVNGTEKAESSRAGEYKSLRQNAIGACIFAFPVFLIGMFYMDMPYASPLMLVLTIPVTTWFGRIFFVNAWKQALHRKANMDTLVALSTGVAFVFSSFNTLYPSFWIKRGVMPPVYFEASSVVIAFVLLGKMLEEKAKSQTSSSLKKLMGLQPKTVIRVADNGEEKEISLTLVLKGDKLLVRPGDKLPVDGEVIQGSSFVDESMISGEPLAVEKITGTKVYAGTINQKGSFQLIALKVGGDTVLARIIQQVREAQGSKAPVQKLADRIAGVFVPVVLLIALLTFLAWIMLGGSNALAHAFLSMITVLVIACPCALGLATPTAIMVGVGKGAEKGILIRDAESLEKAGNIDVILFDKTGTITEGKPEVTDAAYLFQGAEKLHHQSILMGIESRSEHPLAGAVCQKLKEENVVQAGVENINSVSGKGVEATSGGSLFRVGNPLFMKEHNAAFSETQEEKIKQWVVEAKTVICFSDNSQVLAVMAITDRIKEGSKDAIRALKKMGAVVYMLTGDHELTAKAIASEAGIENYKAGMLPDDKAGYVKQLQLQGKKVAMVGDGINDSQAMALADLSIAMGRGSDIAMDVAGMTLISSDLKLVPEAIHLSRLTVRTIRQNLFWAFIYNLIGIPIAAGILFPINGFLLSPMVASAAMALSSVSVVLNSLRVRRG